MNNCLTCSQDCVNLYKILSGINPFLVAWHHPSLCVAHTTWRFRDWTCFALRWKGGLVTVNTCFCLNKVSDEPLIFRTI